MPKPIRYISRGKEAYRFRITNPSTKKRVKISLGAVKESIAVQAGIHLDSLVQAYQYQTDLPPAVVDWLSKLPDDVYEKIVAAGLVAERIPTEAYELGNYLSNYHSLHAADGSRGGGWAKSTAIKRQQSIDDLVRYFGAEVCLNQVTNDDARRWLHWLTSAPPEGRGLAQATASKKVKDARQFFEHAQDENLIDRNPFRKLKPPRQDNPNRLHYVDLECFHQVLEKIQDPEFRLVVALGRFAGFRIPSETQAMLWSDINFEKKMMRVRSEKKAADPNGGHRPCPIFEELMPFFDNLNNQQIKQEAKVLTNLSLRKNTNLRTAFQRHIKNAGVKPWPRLFQNLRASALTDLAERHPLPQVCKWLGNSTRVAERHYFMLKGVELSEIDHSRNAFGPQSESGTKNGASQGDSE